jgi:hypothetical protein
MVRIGCLESLVHYKRMLLRIHEKIDNQVLTKECQEHLVQLKDLDPMRSQRYEEIGMYSHVFYSFWLLKKPQQTG